MAIDKNRITLSDDHILYLNILHFTMTFSIVGFLIIIMILFLGVSAKSPYAEHGFLTWFSVINIGLNFGGMFLFQRAPRKIAASYSNDGKPDDEFYKNITGVIVSMIITRNITLVFPSIMACIALFIAISGGSGFIWSFYTVNGIFPAINLFLLVKNRPSQEYIYNKILSWF